MTAGDETDGRIVVADHSHRWEGTAILVAGSEAIVREAAQALSEVGDDPAAWVRTNGRRRARATSSASTVVPSFVWKTLIARCSSSSATTGRRLSRLPTAFQRTTSRSSFEPNSLGRVGPRSRAALRWRPTPRSTYSRLAEPKQSASTHTPCTRRSVRLRREPRPSVAHLRSGWGSPPGFRLCPLPARRQTRESRLRCLRTLVYARGSRGREVAPR